MVFLFRTLEEKIEIIKKDLEHLSKQQEELADLAAEKIRVLNQRGSRRAIGNVTSLDAIREAEQRDREVSDALKRLGTIEREIIKKERELEILVDSRDKKLKKQQRKAA